MKPLTKGNTPNRANLARLRSMGLPDDYLRLGDGARKKARLMSLRSWFDPDPSRAHILCTDVNAFARAHRLWVEFYLKPDPQNAGIYHFKDPTHKYDMVRMAMAKPQTVNQPAKSACVAPRRSTKTITLIHEMCSMIAVARTTRVQILISEMNDPRTKEEMQTLRQQMESNETIHQDFGGAGVLFPKGRSGGERWNDSTLHFRHNKSVIMGYSTGSKQRGRHPTLGIIDDPEDEDLSRNPEWRDKFFRWLFKTYLPMFGPGGKVMWIGTLIHEYACLQLAMLGCKEIQRGELEAESEEGPDVERDERFDDWNRRVFRMIEEDPKTGEEHSIFPEYMSVEGFHVYKRTHGLAAAMAEFQGECVAGGQFVFHREARKHGYMHCEGREQGADDYMLDLRTGETMPWREFVASLYIVGGGDLSDSLAIAADPGAVIVVGASEMRTAFVLDAYIRRGHVDTLVKRGYDMAMQWGAEKIGWEKAGMQGPIVRWAKAYGERLQAQGLSVPATRAVENASRNKTRKIILGLRTLMTDYAIRFLHNEEVTLDGVVHRPVRCEHARYHRLLKEQVDGFTDKGASGHDDGIEALQIALEVLGRIRGYKVEEGEQGPEESIEKWGEVGMEWPKHMLPRECWTREMWKEHLTLEPAGVGIDEEMDPYE